MMLPNNGETIERSYGFRSRFSSKRSDEREGFARPSPKSFVRVYIFTENNEIYQRTRVTQGGKYPRRS